MVKVGGGVGQHLAAEVIHLRLNQPGTQFPSPCSMYIAESA